jgi:hypothetical protein
MPPPDTRRITVDPDSCPEHSAQCGRTTRLEARVEDIETQARDREHRLTVLETEASSRMRSINSAIPIIVALLSAGIAIWAATRKEPQWQHDPSYPRAVTPSYTAPVAPALPSVPRP